MSRWLLALGLLATALLARTADPARADAPPAAPAAAHALVVGVYEDPPFAIKSEQGEWHGVAVSLWREVAQNENIEFHFAEYELEPMLDALEAGQVDLAIGSLLITAHRERRFDMTSPFMHVLLAIATRPPSWRTMLRDVPSAFSGRIVKWSAGLLVAMVLVGLLVWRLERLRNPGHFGGGAVKGLGDAIWWSASTMSTVGYGDRTPITLWGRVIGVVWMFVSIVLVSTFTATVTSVLTVSQLQSQIRSFRDLTGVRVGVVDGSGAADYLAAVGVTARLYPDVEKGMDDVADGKIEAFVDEWPVLRYLQGASYAGRITVIAQPFNRGFVGFALPRESPRRRQIDVALLEVLGDSAWTDIVRKYFGAE